LKGDKITVNDALISTDVDRLIRIISEKKRISIKELEHLCGMDRRAIDKWIRVLEDEGYISMLYGITGTNLLWLGESKEKGGIDEGEIDKVLSCMPKSKHESYDEVFDEIVASKSETESEKSDLHEDDIKSNILTDFEKKHGQSEETEEAELPPEEPTPPERPEFVTDEKELVEEPLVENEREADRVEEMPEPMEIPSRDSTNSGRIKGMVNAYLNQINKEKAAIEKLKAEKDQVYRERYLSLESKVEADIASITERILEKEGRVLEIKERVLELPDKINEVEKVHEAIRKLESDGKDVLGKTKTRVEQFISAMAKSRGSLNKQMEEGKARIQSEKSKIEELEELSGSMENKLSDVKKTLDETHEQVSTLNESMKDLLQDLEETTEMKADISDMVGEVKNSITEKENELDDLEKQMSEIEKVEQWVREYINDYERKIDEITAYVRSGEKEISSLREKSEAAYMQKYLRELDEMTSMYDSAMGEVTAEEKALDSRIADAKGRLSSLVKESKEMITKLRSEGFSASDFETVRQEAQSKSGTVLQVLNEKEAERGKLFEDFQKARGGRPMRVLPRPIASRTVRPVSGSKKTKKSSLLRKLKGKKKRK